MGGRVLRNKSSSLLVVKEDPTEVLKADKLMVAVHADNATNQDLDEGGSSYGIYVIKPECRKLITLLQKIAVIRPFKNDDTEEDEMDTSHFL
jgi:hypothetical protein